MPENRIAFAQELTRAGKLVDEADTKSSDAHRTILYLSLLSLEISLKAFLERAGMPIGKIKVLSHDLRGLLDAVCHCEVFMTPQGFAAPSWMKAARLAAIPVSLGDAQTTVGSVLCAEDAGASKYPNAVRYGDRVFHMPAIAVLIAAEKVQQWVEENQRTCRYIPPASHSQPPITGGQPGTSSRRARKSWPCPFCRHELHHPPPTICPKCNTGIPAEMGRSSLHWGSTGDHHSPDSRGGGDGRHSADN